MRWYRRAALLWVAIALGIVHLTPVMAQDAVKQPNASSKIAFTGIVTSEVASTSAPLNDPLDAALEHAGMQRSDLGWSPRGWWTRYPRTTLHKLDHFDDLIGEPLAAIPFTRTLAQAVREYLGPEGLAASPQRRYGGLDSHSLYRLTYAAVERRYGGRTAYVHTMLTEEIPLEEAIFELYRYAGEPTRFLSVAPADTKQSISFAPKFLYPDVEAEISRRAKQLSPEVSRIMGRLILDVVDAHRHAALAFRDVTMDQRLEIFRRVDMFRRVGIEGMMMMAGLEYDDVHIFDDVAKSWDEGSLWRAAFKSVEALDRARRDLEALPPAKLKSVSFDWETPLGWIRVRGIGTDLIDATGALLIVDLGGNDRWRGAVGASSLTGLLSLALDLSGDDIYEGHSATQGAGIAGVGILLDVVGNDRYEAEHYAQGVGLLGLGALFDLGGKDVYRAGHSAQGSAPFVGVGLLADAGGNDHYEILADGQGFGGPGGVGILGDRSGNDVYRAEPDAQKSGRTSYLSEVSASRAQGFGAGNIHSALEDHTHAGGLGQLIDIEGDDSYVAGAWAQGAAGYWFGTGLLYDGAGNDRYEGDESTQASASHFGIGVLLDEGGDDSHLVRSNKGSRGLAYAHDFSIALLVDIGGNDRYTIASGEGLGRSLNRSVAMFIDTGGDDVYRGREGTRPGSALYDARFADYDGTSTVNNPWGLSPYAAYVSSIGLFLDVGGTDTYWGGLSDGDVWGDEPDSDNWKVRNVGIGMDVPSGTIDWRPLPMARGR